MEKTRERRAIESAASYSSAQQAIRRAIKRHLQCFHAKDTISLKNLDLINAIGFQESKYSRFPWIVYI